MGDPDWKVSPANSLPRFLYSSPTSGTGYASYSGVCAPPRCGSSHPVLHGEVPIAQDGMAVPADPNRSGDTSTGALSGAVTGTCSSACSIATTAAGASICTPASASSARTSASCYRLR